MRLLISLAAMLLLLGACQPRQTLSESRPSRAHEIDTIDFSARYTLPGLWQSVKEPVTTKTGAVIYTHQISQRVPDKYIINGTRQLFEATVCHMALFPAFITDPGVMLPAFHARSNQMFSRKGRTLGRVTPVADATSAEGPKGVQRFLAYTTEGTETTVWSDGNRYQNDITINWRAREVVLKRAGRILTITCVSPTQYNALVDKFFDSFLTSLSTSG